MFKNKNKVSTIYEPTEFPVGSFVHTEKGYFFITKNDRRLRIITDRILYSWSPHRVIETREIAVAKYKVYSKLKFRNGSLLHSFATGSIYLIVDGKRCRILSPEALERIGAVRKEAVSVSPDELNLHPEGESIS